MIFCVYVISGLCVGIAALIFTSRLMAAQAISGQGFELQAIAAAVVGGASLFGGRGKISNTIVGALIMGVLFNGFVMLDVLAAHPADGGRHHHHRFGVARRRPAQSAAQEKASGAVSPERRRDGRFVRP